MNNFTYTQTLNYLNSFPDYEKTINYDLDCFKPARVECLLNLLGNPHQKLPAIQIAGTKGKGSTAAMVASILTESGFQAGLYTSPHLISLRERMKIGEKTISEEEIGELVRELKPRIPEVEKMTGLGLPTFFEVFTTLAFLFFARKEVDFVILEVGMGGRLDATNVVAPLVAVITEIGFDHTDILGDSLSSIAEEKAGIIKDGSLVVTSSSAREALEVIRGVCLEKKAKLFEVGKDIGYEKISSSLNGQSFNLKGIFKKYENLFMSLLGDHQLVNAATAVGTVELLSEHGITVSGQAIREGLRKVKWPGRLEIVSENPFILLDGAHNQTSAQVLGEFLISHFPGKRVFLILSILRDKDIEGIGAQLCPLAEEVILTRVKSERAASPSLMEEKLKGFCQKAVVIDSPGDALRYARDKASRDDLICLTGSLYLVGEIKSILQGRKLSKIQK